jgi:hypothetical protein
MRIFVRSNLDRMPAFSGFILLAVVSTWAWLDRPRRTPGRPPIVSGLADLMEVQTTAMPEPVRLPAMWEDPAPQSAGAGWVYEVFTPPAIYFNPEKRSFAVTMANDEAADSVTPVEADLGVELIAVRLELYRLQLVGCFGSPGDYTGIFISPGRPDTLLGRTGRRFASLGLVLKELTVEKLPVAPPGPRPVLETAAVAVVHDERGGAEVRLESRTRRLTETPVAVLRGGREPAAVREVHAGDTIEGDFGALRVERIQLDPAAVALAVISADGSAHSSRVLRLADARSEPTGPEDLERRPRDGFPPAEAVTAAAAK